MAHILGVWHRSLDLAILKNTHDNGTTAVSARVLSKVVTAGELLATLVALEWLVVSVEGAVVTLEVFLSTEAARAKSADECLGWIFCQRLLPTSTVDWRRCIAAILRMGSSCVAIVGAWLALRCIGIWCLLLTLAVTVNVCVHGRHAVLGIGFRVVSLHTMCFSMMEVLSVFRKGRARWRRQTGVRAAIFLVKTEALHAFEILFFADLKLLTLVTVVGNVGLSEIDKAELVFGV